MTTEHTPDTETTDSGVQIEPEAPNPVSTPEQPKDLDDSVEERIRALDFAFESDDTPVRSTAPAPEEEDTPDIIFSLDDVIENDAPTELPVLLHDVSQDVYARRLEEIAREKGLDHVQHASRQEGTPERHLVDAFKDHMKEPMRIQEAIKRIKDPENFSDRLFVDGKQVLGVVTPRRKPGGGRTVSGADGRLELALRRGQLKRIPLYNSGFYVDITMPTNRDMDAFYAQLSDALDTYGREFGAHFYMFNDLVIKQHAVDFFLKLVLASTLKHWSKGGNLARHIRLPDLKVILWAISTLMWPEGYEYRHVCTNPETKCTHTETEKIDIRKMYRNNWDLLSPEAVQHMSALNEVRDYPALEAYQRMLTMARTIRFDDLVLHMKVPTLAEYMAFGNKYNGDVINSLHANNEAGIYKALTHGFYRIFTPWVEKIETYKDGELDLVFTEPELIAIELDHLQTRDTEAVVEKQLIAFTGDCEVSHFGYPVKPCPACGYEPKDIGGYYTVDPLYAFFTQLVRKLTLR